MKTIHTSAGRLIFVDEEDFERVSKFRWHVTSHGYAATNLSRRGPERGSLYMHRLILDAPPGLQVDHINGNGLDNRRSNLRLCRAGENRRNMRPVGGKSKYIGVYMGHLKKNKWHAGISVGNKHVHLGSFPTEEAAARARDVASIKYFGEFARLNFPDDNK